VPNSEDFDGGEAAGRASLFVYLTTRLSVEYRAIMDLVIPTSPSTMSFLLCASRLLDRDGRQRPRWASSRFGSAAVRYAALGT
jgi:hypothetical protein